MIRIKNVNAYYKLIKNKGEEELKQLIKTKNKNQQIAVIKKVIYLKTNKELYDVQIQGGIEMYKGNIIEMKTGEGKTLTSLIPIILKALEGNKVFVVTANEYLAQRDQEQLSLIYNFFNLTSSFSTSNMNYEQKERAYSKQIIYGTISEFGFDYLRSNTTGIFKNPLLKEFDFILIDEADSILIDEAKTPLIITSLKQGKDFNYSDISVFVKTLTPSLNIKKKNSGDFYVSQTLKEVWLKSEGFKKAKLHFGKLDELLVHNIHQSLRAHFLQEEGVDYIIYNNSIKLIDQQTGRILKGRSYNDGLQEAIEAKEGLDISVMTSIKATTTIGNLIKQAKDFCGMTGTIINEKSEINKSYFKKIKVIKPNKKIIRKDLPDVYFEKQIDKDNYLMELIKEAQHLNQPILIGTPDILESERVSSLLSKEGFIHDVLNAKNSKEEAYLISMAGIPGKITVSTNMAGRGTDIIIGGNIESYIHQLLLKNNVPSAIAAHFVETRDKNLISSSLYNELMNIESKMKNNFIKNEKKVFDSGGLFVIGYGRNRTLRADNQLRGRSGRQGNPGQSIFLLSGEDKPFNEYSYKFGFLIKIFKKLGIKKIRNIQKDIEGNDNQIRRNIRIFESVDGIVMNKFYEKRDEVAKNNKSHLNQVDALWEEFLFKLNMTKDVVGIYQHAPFGIEMNYKTIVHEEFTDLLKEIDIIYQGGLNE